MPFNRDRLITLRAKKGVTINQIANETGLYYNVIWRIENGSVCNPSFNTVAALAEYFGVPICQFYVPD